MSLIQTYLLTRTFPGNRSALRDFTFQLEPGEAVAIVGLNGAGKTTLINLLMGFLPATRGQARVLERDPGEKEAKREIGYLPEFFFAPENLTVLGYLETIAWFYADRRAEIHNRLPQLMERLSLTEHRGKPLGTLSKGLLCRVGIVRALMHRPRLLLLDEPDWALDPIGRKTLSDLLAEERKNGTSLLISSHVLDIVEPLCDRFVVLSRGRLLDAVTREQLLSSTGFELDATGASDEVRAWAAEHEIDHALHGERHTFTGPVGRKDELVRRLVESGGRVERLEPVRKELVDYLRTMAQAGGPVAS